MFASPVARATAKTTSGTLPARGPRTGRQVPGQLTGGVAGRISLLPRPIGTVATPRLMPLRRSGPSGSGPDDHYDQAARTTRVPELLLQRACACGGGCPRCQVGPPGQESVSAQAGDAGPIAAPPRIHDGTRPSGQFSEAAPRVATEPGVSHASSGTHDFSRISARFGPSGALIIRRAVPVNVPHPDNQPSNIDEADGLAANPVRLAPTVGRSDDPMEVEADQVAEQIIRMPQPPTAMSDTAPLRPLTLSSTGGGRPLASATRAFFESRLGTDLGGVRMHSGREEATAAATLNARAFASGSDIWLGAGEHEGDRRLMGHELAHVLQASDARAAPALIRRYVRTNTTFLWDLYVSKGSASLNVTDAELRDTIEYEDYIRADLVWRFSDTVALGALRRSMDLFAAGARGQRPNYIRSAREAQAAAHGLQMIELTGLGFTGDHMITSVPGWGAAPGSNIDDPDGSAPIWTSAGIALPVAYAKGTVPTMFARFQVTPAISPAVPNIELRAKVESTVVATASGVTMSGTGIEGGGGTGQVDGIGGGAAIPGSNTSGQMNQAVDFEISTDAGRIWFQAGSAPVRFFFTEAAPTPPGGRLRQDALDIVTLAASAPPIPDNLAHYVQSLVFYNPSKVMPAGFATGDDVMQTLTVPHQCDSQAYLMRYLLMTLGLSADVDYFWRGTASSIIVYHMSSNGWYGPSYQYDRPAEDLAPDSPHFLFHALTNVAGTRYDPTYGQSSPGARLESAPGATDQFHSRGTFLATPVVGSPWTCPH
jgi:hypothetical protein